MKQSCESPERRSDPITKDAQGKLIRTHGHNLGTLSSLKEEVAGEGQSEGVVNNMVPAAESHELRFTKGPAPSWASPEHRGVLPPCVLVRCRLRENKKDRQKADLFIGAGGRNRTDMELPPEDFESSASTSFTTPARDKSYTNLLLLSSKKACNFLPGFV